jgi:nucleoside-diphosphate-sugar epimerase
MTRHVVFGTGQIGRHVVEQLVNLGHDVVAVNRNGQEYLHTLYQFTERWVVDDTEFLSAFGDPTAPLDDALATTLHWYRDAANPAVLDRVPAGSSA